MGFTYIYQAMKVLLNRTSRGKQSKLAFHIATEHVSKNSNEKHKGHVTYIIVQAYLATHIRVDVLDYKLARHESIMGTI